MKNPRSRRCFVQSALAAGAAVAGRFVLQPSAQAIEVFAHSPTPRLRLGLAAYSFRDSFQYGGKNNGKKDANGKPLLDMFSFVDYCAEQDCQGAELTSYYFPPDVDPAYLLRLKRHAFLRGVSISGTAVGNSFTHPVGEKRAEQVKLVRRWIEYAATLGAPHIRIFAGEVPAGLTREQAQKNCIESIEEVADDAAKHGVFLGIENHGGIVADSAGILAILEAVRSPWVGVNLDTGNFHTDDPYADLTRCAPYAVNVQFKAEIKPRNGAAEPADIKRTLAILRQAKYQGYVTLEYESAESAWDAVPKWLGLLRQEIGRAS